MKNPKRISAIPVQVLVVFAAFFMGSARAQDPFSPEEQGVAELDRGAEATSARNGDPSVVSLLDGKERSAVVLSIRANAPRTAAELARAIQLMSRIRRWDEVSHWLDEAVKLGLNEATATQMVQSAGAQTFVQLTGLESGLSESKKSDAKKILELASAAAHNPKKLSDSVVMLRSPSKAVRIQGYRALESAGNRGVAALINHVLSPDAAAPTPAMCEAFSLMGKPSFAAWLAAMTTSSAQSRGNLALLAVRTGEPSLTTELCVAANDPRIEQAVRDELAKVAATKNKTIPSTKAVYRHAIEQMQKALSSFQKTRWMDEPDAYVTWQLSSDGRSVLEKPARMADLEWARAVQYANAAMQCGEAAESQSGLAVAVLCENAWRTAQEPAALSLASIVPSMASSLLDSFEFGCMVWDGAEKNSLASAQLVAVRNLGRWANAETIPNPVRERLSNACASGFAPVRYEAAQALLGAMRVQGADGAAQLSDVHFDGRNRLEKVLAEMRMLEGRPLALVVGGAVDLRTHTRTLLESFGYRVLESSSAAQTMSMLREGQPVEVLFIVSRVLEMNLGELTQRIRANPATATCPVAILASSLSTGEHEIAGADSRVVLGSVPPEQADFADIVRRLQIVAQSPNIDAASRNTWRELSSSYWAERQRKFVSSQAKGLGSTASDTPLGQLQWIRIATDDAVPMPKREQASQNFVQSLKQFGLMVSSETVKAQYDEYNKRGPYDSELKIVLGRILDAIEAAKGDRPWAEVAP
jgi:CheY-like chemotaxis protein